MRSATQQLVHQGQHEQAVGARAKADPFVGDGGVARLHRVHRDELRAAGLQFGDAELDRVGIVILGDAEHQHVLRAVPVDVAEFPETAADGVEAGRRHVDRAKAAMRGEIGGAELLGPPAGEGLTLVAAGEEGELARLGGPDRAEPLGGEGQRLLPFDFLEVAAAALASAQQGLVEAGRGVVVHDAGGTLAAQHALVDRMVGVALDVADAAVLQVDADAAAAGAHVAGGGFGGVGYGWGGVDGLHRPREAGGPGACCVRQVCLLRLARDVRRGVPAASCGAPSGCRWAVADGPAGCPAERRGAP